MINPRAIELMRKDAKLSATKKSDWTDAQIKAVLAESAAPTRRKEFGLSPGNLARLILDVRDELFDETKRPFCGCGDSIEPMSDAKCGHCTAVQRMEKDDARAKLIQACQERDVAVEKLHRLRDVFVRMLADMGEL